MKQHQHYTSNTRSSWPTQHSAKNPFRLFIVLLSLASLGTVGAFGWFRLGNAQPKPIASPTAALNPLGEFFRSGSRSSQTDVPLPHPHSPNSHQPNSHGPNLPSSPSTLSSQSGLASPPRSSAPTPQHAPKPQSPPPPRSRAAQLPAPIFATRSPAKPTPSKPTPSSEPTPASLSQETQYLERSIHQTPEAVAVHLKLTDAIALYWSWETPLHTAQWLRIQQGKPLKSLTRSLSNQLQLHLFPHRTPTLGKLNSHQWQQLATQTSQIEQDLQTLLSVYETAWLAQTQLNQATAALEFISEIAPQRLTQLQKQYQQAQQEQAQAQKQLRHHLGLPTDVVLAIDAAALQPPEPPAQDEQHAIQVSLQLRYDYLWLRQVPGVRERQRLDKEKQITQAVRAAIAQVKQNWQILQQRQQQQREAEDEWRLQAALPNQTPEQQWQAYDRWAQTQTQSRQAQLQYHRSHQHLAQAQGRFLDDWGLVVSFREP